MKIYTEEQGNEVVFHVNDVDDRFVPVLESCYYQRKGRSYIKKFPADMRDIGIIARNFTFYAEEMFNQLGHFHPVQWQNALTEFIGRSSGAGIDWWLAGSCAASIRGIAIEPHDLDIMVNSKDVEAVHRLFLGNIVEPIIDTKGWVIKDFGVIFLHARIDIASDPQPSADKPEPADFGPWASKHLEAVSWNGHSIKVPPIELFLNVNRRRGRLERVMLLEQYIVQNHSRVSDDLR